MTSRRPLIVIAALISLTALTSTAFGQAMAWRPQKNIEIIVGASPGGGADHSARVIQKILAELRIGSLTVVNKPGGSYALAFSYLNQHDGDGHFIGVSPINLITNRLTGLHPLSYSDVTPLAQLSADYHVFTVRSDSAIKSGNDLIERLKSDPSSMGIAISPGFSTANHFALGAILNAADVDIRKLKLVVFRSAGESVASLLGGHVELMVSATPAIQALVESGKLHPIAVTSPHRIGGAFSNVPTWKEQSVNAVFMNWRGVIGPKGLSEAQIAFWDQVLSAMVQKEEWKSDLEKNSQEATYMNSKESRSFLEAQSRELLMIATKLGLRK